MNTRNYYSGLSQRLRLVCGHFAYSEPNCLNCEAANAIDVIPKMLVSLRRLEENSRSEKTAAAAGIIELERRGRDQTE